MRPALVLAAEQVQLSRPLARMGHSTARSRPRCSSAASRSSSTAFSSRGRQIGGDQIPWEWSLAFEVIELNTSYTLEMKKDDAPSEVPGAPSPDVWEAVVPELLFG